MMMSDAATVSVHITAQHQTVRVLLDVRTSATPTPPALSRSLSTCLESVDIVEAVLLQLDVESLVVLKSASRSWCRLVRTLMCSNSYSALRTLSKALAGGRVTSWLVVQAAAVKAEHDAAWLTWWLGQRQMFILPGLGDIQLHPRYKFSRSRRTFTSGLCYHGKDSAYFADDRVCLTASRWTDEEEVETALREFKLLRHFDGCPAIARLRDIIVDPRAVCFITEDVDTDLDSVIRMSTTKLTEEHTQYLTWQLLRGLAGLHVAGVVHFGINPVELRISRSCELKIVHLRNAVPRWQPPQARMMSLTESFEVSPGDRPPEMTLEAIGPSYDNAAADCWCAGLVLASLLRRAHPFTGRDYLARVRQVVSLLVGDPATADLAWVTNTQAAEYVRALPPKPRTFETDFGPDVVSDDGRQVLEGLLAFNPAHRLSATAALRHPWFDEYESKYREEAEGAREESWEMPFEWQGVLPRDAERKDEDDFAICQRCTEQCAALKQAVWDYQKERW